MTLASMKKFFRQREFLLFAIIVIMIALVTMRFSDFSTPHNLSLVFNDTSMLIILALGQMLVILTRSIDLSMAANIAFTGMVVGLINAAYPAIPVPVLLAICVALGALLGSINGIFVWKLNIPPIVVTLGTLTIYRGMTFIVSGGQWVNAHQMSADFKGFPRTEPLGLPVLSWIAIVVIALYFVLMTRTPLGRAFYAAGINPTAATYTGINVGKVRFLAFVFSGMAAGLCGYLWVSRYVVASTDLANGFELSIVAACVIGGISIAGGIGTVAGAVLGSLFLGVVNNALPVINISPFWQMAISGSAIILAVVFNARSERKKGRIILKKAEVAA